MNKALLFLCAFLFMLPTVAQAKDESVYDRVMRTGTIRCGYYAWPPIQTKNLNTGEIEGIWTEYTKALAANLELKIDWSTELNLTTYLTDLATKKYDVECASGWPTATRGKFVSYSDTAFYVPYYLYKRTEDTRINEDTDLNDEAFTMAVIDAENTAMLHRKKYVNASVYELPGIVQGGDLAIAVMTKKADFTALDSLSAQMFQKSNPGKLEAIGKPIHFIPMTFTVANDEQALKDMINNAMHLMLVSGETNALLDRYDPERKMFIRVAKPYAQ